MTSNTIKHGIAISSYLDFETIQDEYKNLQFSVLEIDGTLLNDTKFIQQLQKINNKKTPIIVKNLLPPSLCHLIHTQSSKLKLDFLNAFNLALIKAKNINCHKVINSFDIINNFKANSELIHSLYGYTYQNKMEFELSVRLPQISSEQNLMIYHQTIKKLMCNIKIALDLHIYETAFLNMDFEKVIAPVIFDIQTLHFHYESNFGNTLDAKVIDKIIASASKYNQHLDIIF